MKFVRGLMRVVLSIFIIVIVIIVTWSNIKFKPIKIGDVEGINKINLVLIKHEYGTGATYSYELNLTKKTDIDDFITKTSGLSAKRIFNGGGKDVDLYFYIRVDYKEEYKGERLLYCLIYGDQILLTEGGSEAYEMSWEDWEEYKKYIIELFEKNIDDFMICSQSKI